ncbi:Hypothetical predicted protein [Olea europaea subsp. europaea]|uniref:Uncharacterized protein n=1 Tax=Olea europaea subsp. europaea TaxID=158383 RepID=A0A8S0U694_OLEEU|nr:Hypothetical predicted protein [Olea europaea subsp. europaea]
MWVEEPESWMRGDLHVPNRTSIRESTDGTLGRKMRLREFEGMLGRNSQSGWEEGLWVVMAIGHGFLIEVKEFLCKLGYLALWLRLLLLLWVEELENWIMGDLYIPNRTSIRESIVATLGGKLRLRELEGKLGWEDEMVRVRREARAVRENSQIGWGEGLWVVMAISNGMLTRPGLLCTTVEAAAPDVDETARVQRKARAISENSQSGWGEGLWVVMGIGKGILTRAGLLLRMWVEKPESWMRGDLHVPNRTSIRESIDDTLVGKMRQREFEGKLGQFVGILEVGGEKGFGL